MLTHTSPNHPSSSLAFLTSSLLLLALLSPAARAAEVEIKLIQSPDERIEVRLQFPKPGSSEVPLWSATFLGQPLLEQCQLALDVQGHGNLTEGATLLHESKSSRNKRPPMPFGKARVAQDRFRESRFTLLTTDKTRFHIVFRCYNDGIALRYELPSGNRDTTAVITNERSSFSFHGNPVAHVQYLENFQTSHEHSVSSAPLDQIEPGKLLDTPLTLTWTNGISAAITEAALRNYAGMALTKSSRAGQPPALTSQLTPRPDGSKVKGPLPLRSPWRVILIGSQLGALLESTTLYALNEPSTIRDTSWIKPGKITFHWWNGDVYDGKPGDPMLSFEMNRRYIDFCAAQGIPTHSITSTEGVTTPWYFQSNPGVAPGPDTDPTRLRPGFDLPRIKQYADSKGVKLWTWVHQAALRGRVEKCFTAFEKMGWSGMMVDFFDHDDQDHVEFAEEILKAAAKHHILIQLHGIWKPTGLERMYPNLVNHEGALNLEYLKWSDRCTPEHNLKMAFTRLIAGNMDYHLGGFRAVTRSSFRAQQIAPQVLGTRCHMLAMYVCWDNPNPMLADYPTAYAEQPGFDFLQMVPTWWDETRILAGEMGEVLVTARRKGRDWYLGGLSAHRPRSLSIPLAFLGSQHYNATLWEDGAATTTDPNHLEIVTTTLTAQNQLQIHFAADGGFVARLTPQ